MEIQRASESDNLIASTKHLRCLGFCGVCPTMMWISHIAHMYWIGVKCIGNIYIYKVHYVLVHILTICGVITFFFLTSLGILLLDFRLICCFRTAAAALNLLLLLLLLIDDEDERESSGSAAEWRSGCSRCSEGQTKLTQDQRRS